MTDRLSTTEYAVLGLLAEHPTHGFALSKLLAPNGEIGRVFTVPRPLVYRALDRLVTHGYARPVKTEPGDAGPNRVIHAIAAAGAKRLDEWLSQPVAHIRDIRIGFLLKLTLLQRAGQSPLALVRAQQATLATTLVALDDNGGGPPDPVGLWRRHTAAAAAAFLEELERELA